MRAYNPYQRPRIVGMNEQGSNVGTVSVDTVQAVFFLPIAAVAWFLLAVAAINIKYGLNINIAININIGFHINIAYSRHHVWGPPPK